MSRRKANVVLLYEDSRHRSVMHRWLRQYRNIDSGNIRDVLGGNNHGVDQKLGEELQAILSRQNHILIAVRDADNLSVQDRMNRLQERVAESGIAPSRVAFVVPSFNIESWMDFAENGRTAVWTGESESDRQARNAAKRKYPGSGTENCKLVAVRLEDHFRKVRQNLQMGTNDLESMWVSAASLSNLAYEP